MKISKRLEEWIKYGEEARKVYGIYPPGWATVLSRIEKEEKENGDSLK